MDAVFLTMGGILVPLGFYLRVEQPNLEPYGSMAILFGLAVWIGAFFFTQAKDRKEARDKAKEEARRNAEHQQDVEIFSAILNELRRLNGDGYSNPKRTNRH